jgi:hypothetical protein
LMNWYEHRTSRSVPVRIKIRHVPNAAVWTATEPMWWIENIRRKIITFANHRMSKREAQSSKSQIETIPFSTQRIPLQYFGYWRIQPWHREECRLQNHCDMSGQQRLA